MGLNSIYVRNFLNIMQDRKSYAKYAWIIYTDDKDHESYCQIWCMPRKSSGDLVGLFDLFSVNKCHAFNDLCQVFEAA